MRRATLTLDSDLTPHADLLVRASLPPVALDLTVSALLREKPKTVFVLLILSLSDAAYLSVRRDQVGRWSVQEALIVMPPAVRRFRLVATRWPSFAASAFEAPVLNRRAAAVAEASATCWARR